jgi:hypothetical protein
MVKQNVVVVLTREYIPLADVVLLRSFCTNVRIEGKSEGVDEGVFSPFLFLSSIIIMETSLELDVILLIFYDRR